MPLARFRILIREGEMRAGGRIPVHRLDDMHLIFIYTAADIHQCGDPGRVVRRIRLKCAYLQSFAEGFPVHQSLIDRVCLIPVRDDRVCPEDTHRRIDDQAGILHL